MECQILSRHNSCVDKKYAVLNLTSRIIDTISACVKCSTFFSLTCTISSLRCRSERSAGVPVFINEPVQCYHILKINNSLHIQNFKNHDSISEKSGHRSPRCAYHIWIGVKHIPLSEIPYYDYLSH